MDDQNGEDLRPDSHIHASSVGLAFLGVGTASNLFPAPMASHMTPGKIFNNAIWTKSTRMACKHSI